MSGARPVCHVPACAGMLFGWELVLSFILVSVVYAVAIGEPSFGNIAPFAVGLSLVVDLFAGAWCAVCACCTGRRSIMLYMRAALLATCWKLD